MTRNDVRVDWDSKYRVFDNVERRDFIINSAGLKVYSLKCTHLNKEVPIGLHNIDSSCTFLGKPG